MLIPMRMGFLELLVVLAIILLFFGPKQVPKLTAVIKGAVKDFKQGMKEPEVSEDTVNAKKEL